MWDVRTGSFGPPSSRAFAFTLHRLSATRRRRGYHLSLYVFLLPTHQPTFSDPLETTTTYLTMKLTFILATYIAFFLFFSAMISTSLALPQFGRPRLRVLPANRKPRPSATPVPVPVPVLSVSSNATTDDDCFDEDASSGASSRPISSSFPALLLVPLVCALVTLDWETSDCSYTTGDSPIRCSGSTDISTSPSTMAEPGRSTIEVARPLQTLWLSVT